MNRVKSRIESETSEIKEYMYEELIQISNFYNEVFVYLIYWFVPDILKSQLVAATIRKSRA